MRILKNRILLSFVLILILISGLCWYDYNRSDRIAHNERNRVEDANTMSDPEDSRKASESTQKDYIQIIRKLNKPDISPRTLYDHLARYRSAEKLAGKQTVTARLDIANDVASSQKDLWESCAWRIRAVAAGDLGALPLRHFASVYFKKGQQQKDELISLLHSTDVHLLMSLLDLLSETCDADSNGQLQNDKPLGGSEIPPYISRIARNHPELAYSVEQALGRYGSLAKNEVVTLLRVILSDDDSLSFVARVSLLQVDKDLHAEFGLDRVGSLNEAQRRQIEKYIENHKDTSMPARILNKPNVFPRTLYDDVVRYQAAETNAARTAIAYEVASSQPNLWESCAWRIWFATEPETKALAHFASAYFKRGPRQKEELVELLHSGDRELVISLLSLLRKTGELDRDGKMQDDKPLGGSEISSHVSKIIGTDSSPNAAVVVTLEKYGTCARSEAATLLKLALSENNSAFLSTITSALFAVDPSLCSNLGIERDKPLTNEQRTEIEKYLRLQEGKECHVPIR